MNRWLGHLLAEGCCGGFDYVEDLAWTWYAPSWIFVCVSAFVEDEVQLSDHGILMMLVMSVMRIV